MIDITIELDKFAEAAGSWDISRSEQQLDRVAIALDARVDWDPGAGENWGRILSDRSVRALVSVRGPFIFILDGALAAVQNEIDPGFLIVSVTSMESDELTADEAMLLRVFGSRAAELRASKDLFSVDDLWYTTVT
jgi:hypothetical protein